MNINAQIAGDDVTHLALLKETEIRKDSTDAVSTATLTFFADFDAESRYGEARYGTGRYSFRPVEWQELILTNGAVATGKAGVTVSLTGDASDSVVTNANGEYSFSGLYEGDYTVTPTLAGYTATPTSRSFTGIQSNQTGDFSITADAAAEVRQFAGFITSFERIVEAQNCTQFVVTASDYGILLDRTTINATWPSWSDKDIIEDALSGITGITIDPANIDLIVSSLANFEAKDISGRELLERICDLTGGEWRVDYRGYLHYYAAGSIAAPFGLSDAPDGVTSFPYRMDSVRSEFNNAANRITVLGGIGDGGTEITATAQDYESQAKYGILSATVVDRGITDATTADLRARAEISQRAFPIVSGTLTCWKDGLDVGQTVYIRNGPHGISGNYLIRAIRITFLSKGTALDEGDGVEYRAQYEVEFGQRTPDLVTALRRVAKSTKQPTYIPRAVIPDGSLTIDNFASTIEPVRIVTSLPALPDPAYSDNAIVLLTTDRKLYRRSGNTWTATIYAADLGDQVQAGQLAADSVTAGTIAAGAIRAIDAVFEAAAIKSADIESLSASKLTAGTIDASIVNVVNINASNITSGSMSASRITAGTISASVTMTAPTMVITSGNTTVNIDSSNILKVTDAVTSSFCQGLGFAWRVQNSAGGIGQLAGGNVTVTDALGNTGALYGTALLFNTIQVVGPRQAAITSPSAEVNSLKTAVDTIRARLQAHGLTY